MSLFKRWLKFNAVGTLGMLLQLGALALFSGWASGHYLYATAAAVELTLLHNFIWHMHYTWRDRRFESAITVQCIRFHLGNGLVSMIGNLLLMPLLFKIACMPLLVANSVAIVCCSAINFSLGDTWAFAVRKPARTLISTPPTEIPHFHNK